MKITETPDHPWEPWVITVDETQRRPAVLRPEPKGMGTTGDLELEVPYTDYSGWSGARDSELYLILPATVLAEALRRCGYRVEKADEVGGGTTGDKGSR